MQTIRLDTLALQPHHRVLDLGCGEGRHALATYWLTPAQQVVGVDINEKDLRTAASRKGHFPQPDTESRCEFLLADGLRLPFQDHQFDVVICSEVLEHIPDYDLMLQEAYRVLAPGGTLAVSVPRAWPEKICWWLSAEYHQVEGGHIRIFNARQLRQDIQNLGLKFHSQHGAHALHAPYWWLRCLFWKRGEHFAPVRWYHRFLVWDLMQQPKLTRVLDNVLNPVMGKSVVFYFTKDLATS